MSFALTIDGSPHYAISGSLPVTLWNAIDDADEPRGATPMYALETPRVSWPERMRLVDGDLEVGALTFELHDLVPDSGIAAGQPWLTWLGSRGTEEIASAILSTTMTAAATTFVLTSTSASAVSGSIPCVLWVDDEAINCASYNGGTQTVTVATDGRGYYGTKAKAHTVDVEFGAVPEVWIAPPSLNRRRVLLWRVDDATGIATVLWRGYANRPRLSPNGASWQLQCEPAWTVDRARPLGLQTAGTYIRGYDTEAIGFGAQLGKRFTIDTTKVVEKQVFSTLPELLAWAKVSAVDALTSAIATAATGVTAASVDLQRTAGTRRVSLSVQTTGATSNAMVAVCTLFGVETRGAPSNGNPQYSNCEVDVPSAALLLPLPYYAGTPPTIPVSGVQTLPATFTGASPSTVGPHRTVLRTALIGDAGDDTLLVLYPEGSPDPADTSVGGPTITAWYRYFDAKSGNVLPAPRFGHRGAISGASRLSLGSAVSTTHWLYGLRAIVNDTADIVRAGFDSRNFDDTIDDATVVLTESELADREWNLTGAQTLASLAVPTLAAEGCCPAIRTAGKVGFVAIRNPVANETLDADHTFTSADFVAGTTASWAESPAGIVNVSELDYGVDKARVYDQRSINRHGQGRTVSLSLEGLQLSESVADARTLASRVLTRIVQLFGEPLGVLLWTTNLQRIATVFCGDIVSVTDATTPNGAGGRGSTARRCQVIARTIDLARGTIQWEALLLPETYGYAPACKVASISGAVLTIAADYVLAGSGDATDYAGVGGTDRGVSKFATGYKVKLLLRDSTTYDYYSATVASVDAAAGTITLTASVPTTPTDWPALCSSGWVDVVFDDYETSGVTAAQKQYAVCGNGAAHFGGIGSTGEQSRRWGA